MIQLKGTKEGITIRLGEISSLETAREELQKKLGEAKAFFRDTAVAIRLESDSFSAFELYLLQQEIQKILEGTSVTFITEGAEQEQSATAAIPDKNEAADVWHRGTVRSGQVLTAEGNLIVLGDSNPGSELVAGGNILVMGTARGMLHAGAKGNREAFVTAARLLPTQIRIADVISRRPDGEGDAKEFCPEFAEIRDGKICIRQRFMEE